MKVIDKNIPTGFEKGMQFNFPSYYVPLSIYKEGYRNNKQEPLPFASIGVQKNYIAIYHMGIYANKEVLAWFIEEYKKQVDTKLFMGKSCIRFRNGIKIPYTLIGELFTKMTVNDWIKIVEKKEIPT